MDKTTSHAGTRAAAHASVFLSYAHEDLAIVEWEAGSMRLGGLDVFLDVQSLRTGSEWPKALIEAIRNANRFVLFWSRYSAASDWVRNEHTEALAVRNSRGDDNYLQICKLDETPLPTGLANIQYVDRSREELLIVASDEKKRAIWGSGLSETLSSGIIHIERMTPRTTKVIAYEASSLISVRSEQLQRFKRLPKLPASLKLPAWALKNRAEADQQPLILIPSFLGSHLSARGKAVWANVLSLAFGGMRLLRIDRPGVLATSILEQHYSSFLQQVRLSMPVMPCPYDWRLSFEDSSRPLADLVGAMISADANIRPIFVAHGSGSFVVRGMAAFYSDLWKECQARGSRIVFIGAPEHGTYQAAEMMAGSSALLRMLARLDLRHSSREVAGIFRGFPGLLELLRKARSRICSTRAFGKGPGSKSMARRFRRHAILASR
ncbi:MAG TPA: toll/interleukin-1 receptor domain-containing protein [Burkholderiales bacterium]|nr:toll/interleukin-1 receptor domain-containing protein [Burkholderiales bacterium]